MNIKKSLKDWLSGRKPKEATVVPAAEAPHVQAEPSVPSSAELEPEVVAAIAGVIAIEMKMFMSLQRTRFTFSPGGSAQGWSETGRLLVRPYQGVR